MRPSPGPPCMAVVWAAVYGRRVGRRVRPPPGPQCTTAGGLGRASRRSQKLGLLLLWDLVPPLEPSQLRGRLPILVMSIKALAILRLAAGSPWFGPDPLLPPCNFLYSLQTKYNAYSLGNWPMPCFFPHQHGHEFIKWVHPSSTLFPLNFLLLSSSSCICTR